MTQTLRLNAGRIIRAEDFEQQKKTESEIREAKGKAEDIIAAAEARAAEIIANAEANVQSIADDQLERFIDVQAVEKAADGVRDMVMATDTIQRDFEAFTPWMIEFVEASVRRITGAAPQDAHWAGLIEQGLSDIRERWNLVLHCHPTMVADLKAVVSSTPSLSKAIKDVHPDRSLRLEDCLVQSAHGVTDISFSTQMAALVMAIEKLGADDISQSEDAG